jgi:mevalonate kinase
MVESVATQRARAPSEVDHVFEQIRSVVRSARLALENGDLVALGAALDRNHELLTQLQLSTPEIDRLRAIAKVSGARGSKLTGAGGGGCVIALCDGDTTPVINAWKAAGFDAFSATVEAHDRPSAGRILTRA